jgi:hypothetical protein
MTVKYARVFGQNAKRLVRIAWVDKAPRLIRSDVERFLAVYEPSLIRDLPPSLKRTWPGPPTTPHSFQGLK